jgi:hypothetical protein
VWESLARDAVESVLVSFHGRAGVGGTIETVAFRRRGARAPVDERAWWRDELAYALEAPVWERYGTFAGQPQIRAEVVWEVAERRVVIAGRHGESRFEETLA